MWWLWIWLRLFKCVRESDLRITATRAKRYGAKFDIKKKYTYWVNAYQKMVAAGSHTRLKWFTLDSEQVGQILASSLQNLAAISTGSNYGFFVIMVYLVSGRWDALLFKLRAMPTSLDC